MPPEALWTGILGGKPARLVKTRDQQDVVRYIMGFQDSVTSLGEAQWTEWDLSAPGSVDPMLRSMRISFGDIVTELLLIAPKVDPGTKPHRRG